MKECFIVIHNNYAEGMDAYACYKEEDAKKSVIEDVKTVVKDLKEQGYEPTVLWHGWDSVEVYAADNNINYEWSIVRRHSRVVSYSL